MFRNNNNQWPHNTWDMLNTAYNNPYMAPGASLQNNISPLGQHSMYGPVGGWQGMAMGLHSAASMFSKAARERVPNIAPPLGLTPSQMRHAAAFQVQDRSILPHQIVSDMTRVFGDGYNNLNSTLRDVIGFGFSMFGKVPQVDMVSKLLFGHNPLDTAGVTQLHRSMFTSRGTLMGTGSDRDILVRRQLMTEAASRAGEGVTGADLIEVPGAANAVWGSDRTGLYRSLATLHSQGVGGIFDRNTGEYNRDNKWTQTVSSAANALQSRDFEEIVSNIGRVNTTGSMRHADPNAVNRYFEDIIKMAKLLGVSAPKLTEAVSAIQDNIEGSAGFRVSAGVLGNVFAGGIAKGQKAGLTPTESLVVAKNQADLMQKAVSSTSYRQLGLMAALGVKGAKEMIDSGFVQASAVARLATTSGIDPDRFNDIAYVNRMMNTMSQEDRDRLDKTVANSALREDANLVRADMEQTIYDDYRRSMTGTTEGFNKFIKQEGSAISSYLGTERAQKDLGISAAFAAELSNKTKGMTTYAALAYLQNEAMLTPEQMGVIERGKVGLMAETINNRALISRDEQVAREFMSTPGLWLSSDEQKEAIKRGGGNWKSTMAAARDIAQKRARESGRDLSDNALDNLMRRAEDTVDNRINAMTPIMEVYSTIMGQYGGDVGAMVTEAANVKALGDVSERVAGTELDALQKAKQAHKTAEDEVYNIAKAAGIATEGEDGERRSYDDVVKDLKALDSSATITVEEGGHIRTYPVEYEKAVEAEEQRRKDLESKQSRMDEAFRQGLNLLKEIDVDERVIEDYKKSSDKDRSDILAQVYRDKREAVDPDKVEGALRKVGYTETEVAGMMQGVDVQEMAENVDPVDAEGIPGNTPQDIVKQIITAVKELFGGGEEGKGGDLKEFFKSIGETLTSVRSAADKVNDVLGDIFPGAGKGKEEAAKAKDNEQSSTASAPVKVDVILQGIPDYMVGSIENKTYIG